MELMPLIFTMLIIFIISVSVLLSISYILYKLRSHKNSPQILRNHAYSIPGNSNFPEYEIQREIFPVIKPRIEKIKDSERFMVLNYDMGVPNFQPEVSQSYYPVQRNLKRSFNVFDSYTNEGSINIRKVQTI